ncbi:MAG: alpha/beta fold hydrolase [Planctomycetes bacterium]|nr:alpha/beta fold hydrolase [Planctomycetota bacterium]
MMTSLPAMHSVAVALMDWAWTGGMVLAGVLLVGFLLLYARAVLSKYVRIMINILDDVAPTVENGCNGGANGQEDAPLNVDEVTFRATDGHLLGGMILTAQQVDPNGDRSNHSRAIAIPAYRGTVVFAHEFGTDRASCVRYCRALLEAGFDVFAFDFRGHGGSAEERGYRPRQWPSDRELADMLGAIAFIGSHLEGRGLPRDIGLFGLSRGAGAAILASVGIDSVRAIVTDGAYSSDTVLEYLMRRFATIFARIRVVAENHPPVFWRFLRWLLFRECARRFNCHFPSVRKAVVRLGRRPILLIHGEKDSYIPIVQSQMLFDLARGPKSLWIVPGATHNQGVLVQPTEYARRVLAFFEEHLAIKPAETSLLLRRSARLEEVPVDIGTRVAKRALATRPPGVLGSARQRSSP